MQTELGVRGGPSLSLSLASAETTLMIDGHLNWCGPDYWVLACLGLGCGRFSGCFFLCPGCGLVCWFLLVCPGLWGIACLIVLVVPVCGLLVFVYQVFLCSG